MIEACKTKSQVQVSHEFNIARGTLCGYLKDKVNLLKQFEQSTPKSANRKRHREGKEADIEAMLFIWFNEKRIRAGFNVAVARTAKIQKPYNNNDEDGDDDDNEDEHISYYNFSKKIEIIY